jgi:hypothetical protein
MVTSFRSHFSGLAKASKLTVAECVHAGEFARLLCELAPVDVNNFAEGRTSRIGNKVNDYKC